MAISRNNERRNPAARRRAVQTAGAGVSVLAAALLGSLGLGSCSRDTAKSAVSVSAIPVRAVRVESQPLEETLEITGSLVSSVAVEVKTEFAGRLVAMLKKEGDRVRQSETLAQLDDANARLALAQARANLEVAEAALDRAKVAEEHTQIELERAQNLLKSGGITDRDFQAAQMAARDARAAVKLAEAQREQARQALAIAEKNLNDCRIISPITGEVESKYTNPGSWVDGSALLYRLVDNQRLELEAYVSSSDIARVAKGQRIRFSVAAFPGEEFAASIVSISSGVQPQNRSVLVRAEVRNPWGKLKAGMFVKGVVVAGVKPSALLVPRAAIWRRVGQPPYVFLVVQNKAQRREVAVGREQPDRFEVTSGLTPGDLVVAEQNPALSDGVNIVLQP